MGFRSHLSVDRGSCLHPYSNAVSPIMKNRISTFRFIIYGFTRMGAVVVSKIRPSVR